MFVVEVEVEVEVVIAVEVEVEVCLRQLIRDGFIVKAWLEQISPEESGLFLLNFFA